MNTNNCFSIIEKRRKEDLYGGFKHSMVSRRHRYLWIINGKVACVTTTLALRELDGNPFTGGSMWGDEGILTLLDLTIEETEEALTSSQWFRFCFVRNPYHKLFSAYKSKIMNPQAESHYQGIQQEIRELYGYPEADLRGKSTVSFRDFIDFVVKGNHPHDGHWCVQSRRLMIDFISYDFVGRFESFEDELGAVLQRLNAPEEMLEQSPKVHAGKSVRMHPAAAYDRETADLVYATFQEDFENFDYRRDSWMFA